MFPWSKVKMAIKTKLETIIEDFNVATPEDQVVTLLLSPLQYCYVIWSPF